MINRYSDFLFEQTGSKTFKDQILEALEPTILQICERMKRNMIEAYAKKGIDYKWTALDEKYTQIAVVIDMLKSFQKYTKPTDSLISVIPFEGAKGIEINAKIERDGQEYDYYTYAIYAGGYNIQREHLRYLTKTKLPMVNSDLTSEYINKMKSLKKAEKLSNEIQTIENDLQKIDAKFAEIKGITDEQIAKILREEGHWSHTQPSWQQIIKNGAAQNFNNSEAEYLENVEKTKKHGIEFWKNQNIKWPTDRRAMLVKMLAKLNAKLELETRNA